MKRSAPMKRGKPLARGSRLRARRPTKRRSERVEDRGLLAAVHGLPCSARHLPGARCHGPIEADHAGDRPYGRRSHDTEVIPLCRQCHADRTSASSVSGGPFAAMTPAERRTWCEDQIARIQAWWYGRVLVAGDLVEVELAVASGRSTRRLFASVARSA